MTTDPENYLRADLRDLAIRHKLKGYVFLGLGSEGIFHESIDGLTYVEIVGALELAKVNHRVDFIQLRRDAKNVIIPKKKKQ